MSQLFASGGNMKVQMIGTFSPFRGYGDLKGFPMVIKFSVRLTLPGTLTLRPIKGENARILTQNLSIYSSLVMATQHAGS